MSGGAAPELAGRRLAGTHEVEAYDVVYVAAIQDEAAVSCAGRMVAERKKGLRTLVVTVFGGAEARVLGGDQISLDLPLLGFSEEEDDGSTTAATPPAVEGLMGRVSALLEEILRRARPRQVYLPLGVSQRPEQRIVHEAGMHTFHPESGRDLFFYEERPEAFAPGAVRIRLAQMGARLPPAARVDGEAGFLRFQVRIQGVPRLRGSRSGLKRRVRTARSAARQWFASRAWRPLKALGPRLHPLVQGVDGASLDEVRELIRAASARLGASATQRFLSLSADRARRLHLDGHAERYWLLLPMPEEESRVS